MEKRAEDLGIAARRLRSDAQTEKRLRPRSVFSPRPLHGRAVAPCRFHHLPPRRTKTFRWSFRPPQRLLRTRQAAICGLLALRPLRPLPESLPHLPPLGTRKRIRPAGGSGRSAGRSRASWNSATHSSRTSTAASIAAPVRRRVPRASNTASWLKWRARRSRRTTSARFVSRIARDFVYRRLLPYPERIAAAARLLRFYQRSVWLLSLARPEFSVSSVCRIEKGFCRKSTRNFSSSTLARRFPRKARDVPALRFLQDASRRSPSANSIAPPFACCRRTAARWSYPPRKGAAVRCPIMRACAMWRAIWRARISRRFSTDGFRRDPHQRRRLRLHAEGIHASFRRGAIRAGAGRAIYRQDAGCHRISRGAGLVAPMRKSRCASPIRIPAIWRTGRKCAKLRES